MKLIVGILGVLILPTYIISYGLIIFAAVTAEVAGTFKKTIDNAMENLWHYAETGDWL